ncbi:putative defense protein 3 [Babylonia areolata]|uniref:putative defense protein 3 n=1 Tax=Babylonia areolata TaxID=304850 RepID=UPI003FCFD8CD
MTPSKSSTTTTTTTSTGPATHLMLLTLLLVSLLWMPGAQAYPGGAPGNRCGQMMPSHSTAQPQPMGGMAPFTIVASSAYYYGGKRLTVTVSGVGAAMLRGLMLQARDSSSPPTLVGTFSLKDGDSQLKLLPCTDITGTAVTHTGRADKSSVAAYWTAPMNNVGNVTFMATVVQNFTTFYVGLTSTPVRYMAMNNDMNSDMNNDMNSDMNNDMNSDMNNDMKKDNMNSGEFVAGSFAVLMAALLLSRLF